MYSHTVLLNANDHSSIRIRETDDWRFSAKEMVCPITYIEMADAAREYLIFFLKGKPGLYVLLGVDKNANAYVSADGKWVGRYIPARFKAYPFTLIANPEKNGEYGIGLDTAASQVTSSSNGHLLFDNGKPSKFLQERMALLEQQQKAEPMTQHMVKVIRDAGLTREQVINVKRPGEEETRVAGVEVIDEKALNTMSHEEFAKLRDEGVLPLVYAQLLSFGNLRHGLVAGKPLDFEPGELLKSLPLDLSKLFN